MKTGFGISSGHRNWRGFSIPTAIWLTISAMFLFATIVAIPKAHCESDSLQLQCQGKIIRQVNFEGKFRMRRHVLNREIELKSGKAFDKSQLDLDRKRIDSFGLFSEVHPRVSQSGDSVDINYRLTEIWTLTPILAAGRTESDFEWMLGAHERDFLGLFFDLSGFYRRFEGENSLAFSGVFPNVIGRRISMGLSVAEMREKDPLSIRGVPANYRYLDKNIYVSFGYRISEKLSPGIFVGYDRENWKLLRDPKTPASAAENVDHPRYSLGGSILLGRIYSDHYYYSGASLLVSASLIREMPERGFHKWHLGFEGRASWESSGFNFCSRSQYFVSSRNELVYPYAISGYYNVRGYSDKIERGDAYFGNNFEVRHRLIETKHFYTQLAAFADEGTVWGRGKSFSESISDPYWSVGVGLRFSYKRFPRIGRFDLAIDPHTGHLTYYFTSSQFF